MIRVFNFVVKIKLAFSCITAFITNHGPYNGGRRSREISKMGNIWFSNFKNMNMDVIQ